MLEMSNINSCEYDDMIQDLQNRDYSFINPTPLKIANMTIVCKINQGISSLTDFKDELEKTPLSTGIKVSKHSLGKNCIILKWNQPIEIKKDKEKEKRVKPKKLAAKIFTNGSVHITGVDRPVKAVVISNFISMYLQRLYNKENIDTDDTKSFSICMIQSTFDVGYRLDLYKFKNSWNDKLTFINTNNNHPALQIKYLNENMNNEEKNKTCIFVFSTGKILITGAKTVQELRNAYISVSEFIGKNEELCSEIPIKIPQKRGRKRKIDMINKYDAICI